jgi:hypothetical protein
VIFLLKECVLDIDLGMGFPLKLITSTQFSSSHRSVPFLPRISSTFQKERRLKSSAVFDIYCSLSHNFFPMKGISVTFRLESIPEISTSSKITNSQKGLCISENIFAFIFVSEIPIETGIQIHLKISFLRCIANSR